MRQHAYTRRALPRHAAARRRPAPWEWPRRALAFCRRHMRRLALGAALLGLLAFSGWQLGRLDALTPGFSLRWQAPLAGQAAQDARLHAAGDPEAGLWPTFWTEGSVTLKSELAGADARCLWYSGEGGLVWPARFARGGWPGATDDAGCVVSAALAWRLWGSTDVLGKSVEIDGKTHWVRGVTRDDAELCLVQTGDAGPEGGWQAAEFRREAGLQQAQVEAFAQAGGLGVADTLLAGGGVLALGVWLAALPLLLALLVGLGRGLFRLGRRRPALAGAVLLAAVVLLAVALPRLLGLLPGWAIPAKWSDFSHWSALFRQLGAFIDALLGTGPALRDVATKKALLALLAAACATGPLLLWLGAELLPPKRPE